MDSDATVAKEAFDSLALTGANARETVIALLRPSGSHPLDDVTAVQPVVEALIRHGGEVAPALLAALEHDDYEVRSRAATILREVNQRNRVRVPVPEGQDPPGSFVDRPRYEAIDKALAERMNRLDRFFDLQPNSPDAVEAVLARLEALHEQPEPNRLRGEAIQDLGRVGPLGRVAIPDLFRPNPRPAGRILQQMTAGRIDREPFGERDQHFVRGDSTAQVLARMLHPDPDEPLRAALAEGRLDPKAQGTVAGLRQFLQGPNSSLRWRAIRALATAGPAAREAVPDLERLLKEQRALPAEDPDPFAGARNPEDMQKTRDDMLCLEIADALLRIDPSTRPTVLPVLKDCLRSHRMVFTIKAALLLAEQNDIDRQTFEVLLRYYTEPRRAEEGGYWEAWQKQFGEQLSRLSQPGPQGRKALREAGRPLLQSTDVKKRRAAAWVLAPLDPDACLPVLLEALKQDEDGGDLVQSEETLGRLGPKAKAAFAPLSARVAKGRSQLFFYPSEPAALLGALVRIDPDAAIPIVWKLWREDPPKEADLSKVPDWMRGRRKSDWGAVTRTAFEMLLQLGPRLRTFIPTLVEDLQAPEDVGEPVLFLPPPGARVFLEGFDPLGHFGLFLPSKSQDAAWLLVRIGPAAVPALQKLTGDAKPACRLRAALVLGGMKADARPAIPALLALLKDSEGKVRREAVDALRRIDPREEKVAAALMARHADSDVEVRRRLVDALGHAGPRATPTLIGMLARDRDVEVRRRAVRVLGAGPDALPALTAALADSDGDVRLGAAASLGRLGGPALPSLRQAHGTRTSRSGAWPFSSSATSARTRLASSPPWVKQPVTPIPGSPPGRLAARPARPRKGSRGAGPGQGPVRRRPCRALDGCLRPRGNGSQRGGGRPRPHPGPVGSGNRRSSSRPVCPGRQRPRGPLGHPRDSETPPGRRGQGEVVESRAGPAPGRGGHTAAHLFRSTASVRRDPAILGRWEGSGRRCPGCHWFAVASHSDRAEPCRQGGRSRAGGPQPERD
jgi:HEAT repeat protein